MGPDWLLKQDLWQTCNLLQEDKQVEPYSQICKVATLCKAAQSNLEDKVLAIPKKYQLRLGLA